MCSTNLIFLGFITLVTYDEQYKLWSSSLSNFLHSVTVSVLGTNVLSSAHTLSISILGKPNIRTGKIMVLYILEITFKSSYRTRECKIRSWMIATIPKM
jgi:hypothetical protein